MPPSQLKRLKASLREQGLVGPQKSKKQKKQNAQNGTGKDKRVNRTAALTGIREQFNPFEVKTSSRGPKFDVTSNSTMGGRVSKSIKGRPGVTKGLGEENRRSTLLREMQRRNKVGGIIDKRFGENDPTMTPEDKMLERFTQENTRRHKNSSMFDLEEDEDQGELTHMGQSLSLDAPMLVDDFDNNDDLRLSDAEDHPSDEERKNKRGRPSEGLDENGSDEEGLPERKKTKQEVMKEVIAKSKLHKYERQAAKDEDEDLREELDQEMPNLHALLRELGPKPALPKATDIPGMNPDRAALLNGTDKIKFDKDYDLRLKQLAQDQKSKPTERSKTEEEKAAEESRRLQDLEGKRLRRMQGQVEDEDEPAGLEEPNSDAEDEEGEDEFHLGSGIRARKPREELDVEDEDDFIIDDDLVASASDVDLSDGSASESDEEAAESNADDDDFVGGLLTEEEAKRPEFLTGANAPLPELDLPATNGVEGNLAYTFVCPQSHAELLRITKSINILDLPTVVQRIRALYHPNLKAENKSKLANFTVALVDHISYLVNQVPPPPFSIIETLIRHVHSLAKIYPAGTANAFRKHLETLDGSRPLSPSQGDLIILTAIGSIFPTSDHFHQVVTPAMLTIGRFLGQKIPHNLSDYALGLYMATLCLHYQRLSKRYVPELIGFVLNTISALAPAKLAKVPGNFPCHKPKIGVSYGGANVSTIRALNITDTMSQDLSEDDEAVLKVAILATGVKILDAAADIWSGKSAFQEVFSPALEILHHLEGKACRGKLPSSLQVSLAKTSQRINLLIKQAQLARRPLELHHHRPLAIKMSIPKFEESFNPDKHYDPDRERADASKLRAEHKRERKGAMRELRKDANFIARESLREKKERDAAYEKKYKRLVAEIQGEEGRENKQYEREKQLRKKGRKG
ncbi:MAG: nucleolar complex protein 14 [Claussenomyces sp. TS43310]|nr:MAG: nucleolar complex protein 14 [Claussenomyces sp. TS43310]